LTAGALSLYPLTAPEDVDGTNEPGDEVSWLAATAPNSAL